jgi:Family of unknown function (DUF5522)
MRARIFDAHAAAMAAGEAAYLDPATGLLVLTAETLAARGDCCENGSRARRVAHPGAQNLGSGAFGLVREPSNREREARGVLPRWEFLPTPTVVLGCPAPGDLGPRCADWET